MGVRDMRLKSRLVAFGVWLVRPGLGLFLTWIALMAAAGATLGVEASGFVMTTGLTLLLAVMVAVPAYLPPGRPFRELSALATRLDQLFRVATGAALFGAAAAFGALVGKWADVPQPESGDYSNFLAEITWSIVLVALPIALVFLGMLLASDLRRASRRALLVAIGRLRRKLVSKPNRKHPIVRWLAGLVLAFRNSEFAFVVGCFTPVTLILNVEWTFHLLGLPSFLT